MLDCPKCNADSSLMVDRRDRDTESKCRIQCLECGDVIRYSVTREAILAANTDAEYEALLLKQSGTGWRIDPAKVVERYA